MRVGHAVETLLVRGLVAGVRSMSWRASLRLGAGLGEVAHGLRIRRSVAEANLALALPDRSDGERARILRANYRHLGQAACEYARLAELSASPLGGVIAAARGLEHIDAALQEGRGAILMSGHYGTVELLAAWLGRRYPVDIVLKPLSNPGVGVIHFGLALEAGVGVISTGAGVRRIFAALRDNRCVAMLADQDARGDGIFVPFMGRPSSTPVGPGAIAARTGAPIVMGFITRRDDGRHEIDVLPPLRADPGDADPARSLTARHTACLEEWVRRHPEMWLWLHRRWKTPPPEADPPRSELELAAGGVADSRSGSAG